ncbi:cocaine- and amphetamine-regulated transcript protein-like isoform X2 [Oxyura jamaicensis]|uniref:cocaine- and amphetamine-regulated transcript protein-like isoform X2 n=1 Tax=Oxyura jamaicensis TaxID=8884 RepID=UPI0015A729E2|nr:cocaine- and amphetamine-regulated transcript protein-like isoform X2 [Oxyura jamaicensis]
MDRGSPDPTDPRGEEEGSSLHPALVEALQEVLEKLRSRELPAVKKKLGRVPSCQPREPCAVRMGARFGTRCSCPPGTACDLHVLECS